MSGILKGWFECPICGGEFDRSVMISNEKRICLSCWEKKEEGEASIHIDHAESPLEPESKPALV
jgi:hypothetical protein